MNTSLNFRSLSNLIFIFLWVAGFPFFSLPAALDQEREDPQEISQEEIEKYEEMKKAAKKERIEKAVEENETGTDQTRVGY